MDITVAVVVVTKSREFFQAGVNVINDVRSGVFQRVSVDGDWEAVPQPPVDDPLYNEARDKAIHYLSQRKDQLVLLVVQASTLERAARKLISLRERTDRGFQVGMAYVDLSAPEYHGVSVGEIDSALAEFYDRLGNASVPAFQSSFSTVVFVDGEVGRIHYQPMNFIKCVLPGNRTILQTWLLCLWMDFFEMSYANSRVKPGLARAFQSTMADVLTAFLTERAGANWLTFYYTGSIVSNLINAFETCARKAGALVLRGPNEHSLACGAMANWQLYGKPFVTIVTSGMVDEFKGTLANLREARAKGFIICAEQRQGSWFAFQSTLTPEDDSREVMRARNLPCVYMDDPTRLATDLETAMTLYDKGEGPVVVLVTQTVMEITGPLDVRLPPPPNSTSPLLEVDGDPPGLDEVMAILNSGPSRVLWQCGPLDEDESELVHSIAARSGIALADGLAHPGTIPKFRNGVRNPHYLGTLSVYGFSEHVYHFLHTDGKINSRDEQCLFFVKSKIPAVATPFTEAKLDRKFKIVQVTRNPAHVAPFSDHPLIIDSRAFLHAVDRRLNVDPALLARRRDAMAAMASIAESTSDIISKLPVVPMSPNYFFHQLNRLVESLIARDGYDYTGVYDVGRCGLSAVRNVARTRRGFSGWYGRALMGDALMSILSLAHTCPTDLIAFVGDGASAMTPDVLPSFIENVQARALFSGKTITIFTFYNGSLSVINTYQERILFKRTSRQVRLVNITADDWEERVRDLRVVSRTLDVFDRPMLEQALLERGRLNLFTIKLSHNNEGDGLSLASVTGWQRDMVANQLPTVVAGRDVRGADCPPNTGELAE